MIKLARNSKPSRIGCGLRARDDRGDLGGRLQLGHDQSTTSTSASSTTVTTQLASELDNDDDRRVELDNGRRLQPVRRGSGLLSKFQSGEQADVRRDLQGHLGASKSLTSLTIAQQPPDSLLRGDSSSATSSYNARQEGLHLQWTELGRHRWHVPERGSGRFQRQTCSRSTSPTSTFPTSRQPPGLGRTGQLFSKTVNGISLSCMLGNRCGRREGTGTFCVTDQGVLGYVAWTAPRVG